MSKLPLEIAFKFLRSKHSSSYLSFIAVMSGMGLVLGICSLIIITSVMNGFERVFEKKLLGMVPQASIHLLNPITNWQEMAHVIASSDDNILSVAPYQQVRAMTSINGDMHGTIINGIIPAEQSKVSILDKIIVKGSLDSLNTEGNIILGKSLVDKHQLKLGDKVSILKVSSAKNSVGVKPEFYHLTLSGVFTSTEKIDNWFGFVSLNSAFDMLNKSHDEVKSFRLRLDDVMKSDKTVKIAAEATGQEYYVANNWKMSHSGVYKSLQMNKTVIALLLFLIIVVSAFNIVSALMMMITEKKENIAVLKSYGANKRFIFQVFIYQGIIIGAIGSILGVLLGVCISGSIGFLSEQVNGIFNLHLFDHYFVERLPSYINWVEILWIVISSMIICILATVLPALKASKIIPARVLGNT